MRRSSAPFFAAHRVAARWTAHKSIASFQTGPPEYLSGDAYAGTRSSSTTAPNIAIGLDFSISATNTAVGVCDQARRKDAHLLRVLGNQAAVGFRAQQLLPYSDERIEVGSGGATLHAHGTTNIAVGLPSFPGPGPK
jgi:hypothetical protein